MDKIQYELFIGFAKQLNITLKEQKILLEKLLKLTQDFSGDAIINSDSSKYEVLKFHLVKATESASILLELVDLEKKLK